MSSQSDTISLEYTQHFNVAKLGLTNCTHRSNRARLDPYLACNILYSVFPFILFVARSYAPSFLLQHWVRALVKWPNLRSRMRQDYWSKISSAVCFSGIESSFQIMAPPQALSILSKKVASVVTAFIVLWTVLMVKYQREPLHFIATILRSSPTSRPSGTISLLLIAPP